jgi:hypothetical protein
MAKNEDYRKLVFKYLNDHKDIKSINFKQLREYIETELNLEPDSCKTGAKRQLVEQYIGLYIKSKEAKSHAKQLKCDTGDSDESNSEFTTPASGRYSEKETALIKQKVTDYCIEKGIEEKDLVAFYSDGKRIQRKALINSIRASLPHRPPDVRHLFLEQPL